jgi:hypothetical protein
MSLWQEYVARVNRLPEKERRQTILVLTIDWEAQEDWFKENLRREGKWSHEVFFELADQHDKKIAKLKEDFGYCGIYENMTPEMLMTKWQT